MGIFDRIGTVLRSYLVDGDNRDWREESSDPDVQSAFDELDEFLSQGSRKRDKFPGGDWSSGRGGDWGGAPGSAGGRSGGGDWSSAGGGGWSSGSRRETERGAGVGEGLARDFAELGLLPGASEEECKAAYKLLLKKHHPDRHAGHPGNLKKATEKTTRLNAAYDRILQWRQDSAGASFRRPL